MAKENFDSDRSWKSSRNNIFFLPLMMTFFVCLVPLIYWSSLNTFTLIQARVILFGNDFLYYLKHIKLIGMIIKSNWS